MGLQWGGMGWVGFCESGLVGIDGWDEAARYGIGWDRMR